MKKRQSIGLTSATFSTFKELMDADIDAKIADSRDNLPIATEYDLGVIKVGEGLGMDVDDRLNVTIEPGDKNVIEGVALNNTKCPVDKNKNVLIV